MEINEAGKRMNVVWAGNIAACVVTKCHVKVMISLSQLPFPFSACNFHTRVGCRYLGRKRYGPNRKWPRKSNRIDLVHQGRNGKRSKKRDNLTIFDLII